VEQLQGQERRVIIISTVRSTPGYLSHDFMHKLGFVGNPKRFNVAITRAQVRAVGIGRPRLVSGVIQVSHVVAPSGWHLRQVLEQLI
jgi:superfamily I DNA and/or RNA helicase